MNPANRQKSERRYILTHRHSLHDMVLKCALGKCKMQDGQLWNTRPATDRLFDLRGKVTTFHGGYSNKALQL